MCGLCVFIDRRMSTIAVPPRQRDLEVILDCLEMREEGGPRRWYLARNEGALLQEIEWSWSLEEEHAVKLPSVVAEAMKAALQDLPFLPTSPPLMPLFVTVIYGGRHPELPVGRAESSKIEKPSRVERIRQSAHHPTPSEVFEREEKRHLA